MPSGFGLERADLGFFSALYFLLALDYMQMVPPTVKEDVEHATSPPTEKLSPRNNNEHAYSTTPEPPCSQRPSPVSTATSPWMPTMPGFYPSWEWNVLFAEAFILTSLAHTVQMPLYKK